MAIAANSEGRNQRIDLLRGWLILLVIVGHIVLGSVHDNTIRYIIYAFHMPVFIGMSGYLINLDKLKVSSFISLLNRYWWRVLLPFAFAFVFYTGILLIHAQQEARLTPTLIGSFLTSPYYHLWFIPTLVIWVVAFWGSLKLSIPRAAMLIAFLVITALWACFNRAELWPWLSLLLSKKFVYFFGFFLFGAWLKTPGSRKLMKTVHDFKALPAAFVMICAIIYLFNMGSDHSVVRGLAWLVMNLSLIVIGVVWALSPKQSEVHFNRQRVQTVVAIGRISLPIYLWHMVPMFLLKGWDVHQTQPYAYYAISIIAVTVLVGVLIKLEGKSTLLNKALYGTA